MARSRVAFVAIRMAPGPQTEEPQAIVVGTMPAGVTGWKENDWRYACYRLSDFLALLKDGQNNDPLVAAGTGGFGLSATFATREDFAEAATHEKDKAWKFGRLHEDEHDALDEVGIESGFLNDKIPIPGSSKKIARVFSAFPLRDIEQIYFYTAFQGNQLKLEAPFAALDTARTVTADDEPAMPFGFTELLPTAGKDAGSRIVLLPDFSEGKLPGALSAVSVHLEVKVAANGQFLEDDDDAEIVDPRMLIDAGARNRPTALFPANEHRGASFDVLRLRCSIAPRKISKGLELKSGIRDLLRFTQVDGRSRIEFEPNAMKVDDHGSEDGIPYRINFIPALDALGLPRPHESFRSDRFFGFRFLSGKLDDPVKTIGWRFETHMFLYGADFG